MTSGTQVRRDIFGSVLGILTFLGGIALLLLTFRLAYDMFEVPPPDALGISKSKVIEWGSVGNSLTIIVLKIVLLLIMGVVGSLIANRGISLFTHSRGFAEPSNKRRGEKPEGDSAVKESSTAA